MAQVTLVIFEGGPINSELEEKMHRVRRGIVLDLINKAGEAGFERIILATSYPEFGRRVAELGVEVAVDNESGEEPFHFGRHLWALVQRYGLEKVVYMGGAAAPLVSCGELKYIREILAENEKILVANNFYSADIVGFTPGSMLGEINLPAIDNTLALALSSDTGVRWLALQRSLGLNFDMDTPADLLIMSVHPDIGPYTKEAVQELQWDFTRYDAIKALVGDPSGELVLYGRIGSNLFQYLDSHTRCRLRLFSEERGLKALGRDRRGEVVSLLGRLAEELGFRGFFEFLGEIAQGAVLDSRVLFEHFHWKLTPTERFASDLGDLGLIPHPGLREFTQAALNAPIPILLGGHSLVTGGIWALIDAGLKEKTT
ncbi:MAG TPA: hypothetical protein GX528_07805 [Firmicutes bacterium]|nr:hypothetical protein [Bacillota bacterium]